MSLTNPDITLVPTLTTLPYVDRDVLHISGEETIWSSIISLLCSL